MVRMKKFIPIAIISSAEMGIAAERFATQINENAGRFARFSILPEMNHNEIVAWGLKVAKVQ